MIKGKTKMQAERCGPMPACGVSCIFGDNINNVTNLVIKFGSADGSKKEYMMEEDIRCLW